MIKESNDKMNLAKETQAVLKENGRSKNDILWIGCREFKIDNFWEVAAKTDYDNGYGSQEIASDLIIVGKDFIMRRREYDGSEWWEFEFNIKEPSEIKHIKYLSNSDLEADGCFFWDNDTLLKLYNLGQTKESKNNG
jgi:hypothetical protein